MAGVRSLRLMAVDCFPADALLFRARHRNSSPCGISRHFSRVRFSFEIASHAEEQSPSTISGPRNSLKVALKCLLLRSPFPFAP